jgi:S-formylglutathione hydrolase FrmB
MAATLSAMAGELRVQETMDGHNWTSWRDGLHDAFGWLLPGDARIVYP